MSQQKNKLNLLLGWHLNQPSMPCLVSVENLNYHTAILAQSGSGKSFMVGRYLEELLICTQAKVVIFDPNGDFRYFNKVDTQYWNASKKAKFFGKFDDYKRNKKRLFKKGWETVHIQSYKGKPIIHFCSIPISDQLKIISNTNDETIYTTAKGIIENLEGTGKYYKRQKVGNTLLGELEKQPTIFAQASERLKLLDTYSIWINNKRKPDIMNLMDYYKDTNHWRAVIFDFPSYKNREEQMILTHYCLDTLWNVAVKRWEEAMQAKAKKKKGDEVKRIPLYIVLDEAHNFLSDNPEGPWSASINEKVTRIAAEGRKYGLFLIISTQRPSKVPSKILSECDNICLLRLNSSKERKQVADLWGIPQATINQVMHFRGPGDCLLFGRWVPSLYAMHAICRRTMEGGANLEDDWQKPEVDCQILFEEYDK